MDTRHPNTRHWRERECLCLPSMYVSGETVFALVGSSLGLIAAATMLFVMASDVKLRSEVRPRMLIQLAFLDTIFSIAAVAYHVNAAVRTSSFKALGRLGLETPVDLQLFFFLWYVTAMASWIWTVFIADLLMFVTIQNKGGTRKKEEAIRWQWYNIAWSVLMAIFCIAFACVDWAPDMLYTANSKTGQTFVLGVYTFGCWVWIIFCGVGTLLHHAQKPSETSQFLRQMLWFLIAFISLNFAHWFLVFQKKKLSPTLGYAVYLGNYLPLANALIWGFNRTCAMRCVDIVTQRSDAEKVGGASKSIAKHSHIS